MTRARSGISVSSGLIVMGIVVGSELAMILIAIVMHSTPLSSCVRIRHLTEGSSSNSVTKDGVIDQEGHEYEHK